MRSGMYVGRMRPNVCVFEVFVTVVRGGGLSIGVFGG